MVESRGMQKALHQFCTALSQGTQRHQPLLQALSKLNTSKARTQTRSLTPICQPGFINPGLELDSIANWLPGRKPHFLTHAFVVSEAKANHFMSLEFTPLRKPDFSDKPLQTICELSNMIACECPAYLADLLRHVRRFRRYIQIDCLELVPEETGTHAWLSDQILQIEASLSLVLLEFMERGQLLDDCQQVDSAKLAQHQQQAALRQQRTQR